METTEEAGRRSDREYPGCPGIAGHGRGPAADRYYYGLRAATTDTEGEKYMVITYPLNSEQAAALFAENAVMMDSEDVIYDYRVAGLFGLEVCAWAESCMSFDGYMKCGRDWGSWGGCHCNYFTRAGFRKLVSHHNYLMCSKESDECEGGKIWRDLWQARSDRMDAAEREEDRKREERKAKRAAARKAKEEAQKKEQEAAV